MSVCFREGQVIWMLFDIQQPTDFDIRFFEVFGFNGPLIVSYIWSYVLIHMYVV
jgi:hypothetical protein